MPLTASSVNSTQLRKESVNLKTGQQRLPKLKQKEKKKSETKQNKNPRRSKANMCII